MRFPLAAVAFIATGFIFLAFWGFSSFLMTQVGDALDTQVAELDQPGLTDIFNVLPTAFGIICAIFFIVGILLFFIFESNIDEPEMYWRRY